MNTYKNRDESQMLKKMSRRFTRGLGFVLLLLAGVELFSHRYGEFGFEDMLFFPAIYGLIAFVVVVMISRLLRPLLMREETYYDD